MNRYSQEEVSDYLGIFYDKSLISYKLENRDLNLLKYFLIYALFNFPDRAFMIAQCIKVLFDTTIRFAICAGLEQFMHDDDITTTELIYAITNIGDYETYCKDVQFINLLSRISKEGF